MTVFNPAITDKEAMAMLKAQMPDCWQMAIRQARIKIKQVRAKYKMPDTDENNRKAVVYAIEEGFSLGYFALKTAASLIAYKYDLEQMHEEYELRTLHIQAQIDKLPTVKWSPRTVEIMGLYYRLSIERMQVRIDRVLQELILVAKLLGTDSTVPEAMHPHRHNGRDRGTQLHA